VVNPVPDIRCSRRLQNALFYPFMVFTVVMLKILVLWDVMSLVQWP